MESLAPLNLPVLSFATAAAGAPAPPLQDIYLPYRVLPWPIGAAPQTGLTGPVSYPYSTANQFLTGIGLLNLAAPSYGGLGGLGGIGNIGNVGNLGGIGNIGNLGNVGGINLPHYP